MGESRSFKFISNGEPYNLELGFIPDRVTLTKYTDWDTDDEHVKFYWFKGMPRDTALEEITTDDALNRGVVANGGFSIFDRPNLFEVFISAATQANPCVITSTNHGLLTGDKIHITGVVGMVQLNDQDFTITVVNANSFSIGVNSGAYGAYASGGKASLVGGFKGIRIGANVVGADNDEFYLEAHMDDIYEDLGKVNV